MKSHVPTVLNRCEFLLSHVDECPYIEIKRLYIFLVKSQAIISLSNVSYVIVQSSFYRAPVPEIIDPVFAKTSQNARFLLSENERFGLVFVKTGSIIRALASIQNSAEYVENFAKRKNCSADKVAMKMMLYSMSTIFISQKR
jgi:hypothetical protein